MSVTLLEVPAVVNGRCNVNPAGSPCIAPYLASDGLVYWRIHSDYTEHGVYVDPEGTAHEAYATSAAAFAAYDQCFPPVFARRTRS